MSDPSDSTDDAWDDVPKSTEEDKPKSGEDRVDTVPPPASGDAYSADTVIRDVPREALEAIRDKQRAERRAAKARTEEELPKISGGDDNPSAETRAAKPAPEVSSEAPKSDPVAAKVVEPKAAEPKPEPKAAEPKAAEPKAVVPAVAPKAPEKVAAPAKPRVEKTPRVQAPAARYEGPEPVTSSELLIAVAGAVIAVVAGFYLISSAF